MRTDGGCEGSRVGVAEIFSRKLSVTRWSPSPQLLTLLMKYAILTKNSFWCFASPSQALQGNKRMFVERRSVMKKRIVSILLKLMEQGLDWFGALALGWIFVSAIIMGLVMKLEEIVLLWTFKKVKRYPLEAFVLCLFVASLVYLPHIDMNYNPDTGKFYPSEAQRQFMQTETYAKYGGFRM